MGRIGYGILQSDQSVEMIDCIIEQILSGIVFPITESDSLYPYVCEDKPWYDIEEEYLKFKNALSNDINNHLDEFCSYIFRDDDGNRIDFYVIFFLLDYVRFVFPNKEALDKFHLSKEGIKVETDIMDAKDNKEYFEAVFNLIRDYKEEFFLKPESTLKIFYWYTYVYSI